MLLVYQLILGSLLITAAPPSTVPAVRDAWPHAMATAIAQSQPTAGQPAPTPATPARAPRPRAAASAARPSFEIEVTDPAGKPVADVKVTATGPVERGGATDQNGALRLANLRAGAYRLRFEREGFVPLERDVTLAAATRAMRVDVKVNPAPAPPAPPPAPPPPAATRPEPARPVGEAKAVQVAAFAEKNFIGKGEPQKISVIGCTGYATSRLLQLREPIDNRVNEEADETFYLVAGEVTVRVAGNERALDLGTLFVIPRGMPYTLTRRGRNPAILVSVLSGPPCYEQKD